MPIERQKIARALSKKHFRLGAGDHDYYWLYVDDVRTGIYTKLSRGEKYRTIGDGLVKEIARQIKLQKGEFLEFVQCTLSGDAYVALLKSRNEV